jgi:hypothetical protein
VAVAAASLVNYVADECSRIRVLRAFGFGVAECRSFPSFPQFEQLLHSIPFDTCPKTALASDTQPCSRRLTAQSGIGLKKDQPFD